MDHTLALQLRMCSTSVRIQQMGSSVDTVGQM